jgi:transcriptional regulator with XRE-family HTH domain
LRYDPGVLGADLVREARRRAGLTQRELAERAGTTQSAMARLESGRTKPSFDLVVRLIRLCGFRLDVALDPYDDSDIAQAEALLKLPVEDRLDHMQAAVAFAHELREEYRQAAGG